MNPLQLKLIGYFVLLILILNLVLFAFTFTNWIIFWAVLLLGFIFVWKILPWVKMKYVH